MGDLPAHFPTSIMLDNLTQKLAKVVKNLRGQARLTDDNIQDMLREVRMALLGPTSPCRW